jgi:transcriptional regulator with XRE-family HTH domain
MTTIDAREVHERMMRDDEEYRREYDALEEEFQLMSQMLQARSNAGLTQAELAERMGISQPAVAKIESGRNLSLRTLKRYAAATRHLVRIVIEPIPGAEVPRKDAHSR